MAYNTKVIKGDQASNPVPQHFNPTADDYEPVYARNNAMRVELYGPDGNPISTSSGKLAVRASEIETALADILAKIIAAPATSAKQDTIISHVDGVESALTTLNAKDFATQTTLAAILTQLNTTGLKKIIDPLPAGTNIMGKVGIDQTTPGTTNKVVAEITGSRTPTHSTVAVGTSSGQALASNANRKYACFINDSDAVIYLKVGSAAALNQGIRLNANGGSYEMSANIGNLMVGAVNAISSAASKNLLVLEGV